MACLSEGHYKQHPLKDEQGKLLPGPVVDPVLIKKSQCRLVTGLPGWGKQWFIQYGVKKHRARLTPEQVERGYPSEVEETLVLRQDADEHIGSQGSVLAWPTEREALEFLDSLEDYKPGKGE